MATMDRDEGVWVYEHELPDLGRGWSEAHDEWHVSETFDWPEEGAVCSLLSRGPLEQFLLVNRDEQGIHVVHLQTRIVAVAHLERAPVDGRTDWALGALERWLHDPAHRTIRP